PTRPASEHNYRPCVGPVRGLTRRGPSGTISRGPLPETSPMGIRWYKVHGGRLSFREYWKMAPDPFTFLIAAGAKLFGGLPMNFSIPYLDRLDVVELDDLPGGPRRTLKRGVAEFEDAGFDFQFV